MNQYATAIPTKPIRKVSPTSRLINFRKKRYESKKDLARKIIPDRSFERLLIYSNSPKLNLETSLKKLKFIQGNQSGRKSKRIEDKLENSLAKELLPALEETVDQM